MRCYSHLSDDERDQIGLGKRSIQDKVLMPISELARVSRKSVRHPVDAG